MRPFLSSWQQRRSRVSLYWTNSFAACFWVSCDTVGFYHCVLGKSLLWLSLLGSCPFRCLLCCPLVRRKSGWGICVLPFVFGGLCFGFMICHVSCDHLCPCWSFLDHSFFSCKDRALERDRPYQRKKNTFISLKPIFISQSSLGAGALRVPCSLPWIHCACPYMLYLDYCAHFAIYFLAFLLFPVLIICFLHRLFISGSSLTLIYYQYFPC